ncbi:Esterase/lipase superfamily enzyme [Cognatiyoonia sediminum]|uniref:Esterase/lipase superfamily enzyme n=1 Tax=Cognatiyoonia sediminum TaxID=1508389 RepID=A0A1M5KZ60_9RHOB|nr:alpha/beta hydrolase [Cognatiyoonia sediminum]SHG58041.1 Esterase/lipase superfamily enzyme [Cognatiyoonia sediminum]
MTALPLRIFVANWFGVLAFSCFVSIAVSIVPSQPSAQTTQADVVIPYITLRDRTGSDDLDDYYGQDRSEMSSGRCLVDIRGFDFLSTAAEISPIRIPEEILSVEAIEEVPRDALWAELKDTANGRAPNLYVHGFFIGFEKGCRRAASFTQNTATEGAFMWFSWPSDGNLLNYARDEVDMYWSVPDLAETILEMQEEFGEDQYNLVGHSLGTRGLFLSLYHLSNLDPQVQADNVVLLAPDIDFEIFRKLLPRVIGLANRITIYTAPNDRPLGLSRQLHGYERLGESGNDVALLEGVEIIETDDLDNSSPSGHLYHLYSDEVGTDLNLLLTQSLGAADRPNLKQISENRWSLVPFDDD